MVWGQQTFVWDQTKWFGVVGASFAPKPNGLKLADLHLAPNQMIWGQNAEF
jgi:hypothetical protein